MASAITRSGVQTGHGKDGFTHPALHHVNLKTTQLDELIKWYGQVVGMHPTFRYGPVAFLTNDGANHRLALFEAGFVEDPDRDSHAGMLHTAFEFPSLEDLIGRYHSLKLAGIDPFICIDHGLTMSFYYKDPDGNQVELQADNFTDWTASSAWMRTSPEFLVDPLGRAVDPDKIAAALADGLSAWEIHERAYAGSYLPNDPPQLTDPYQGWPAPDPHQSDR